MCQNGFGLETGAPAAGERGDDDGVRPFGFADADGTDSADDGWDDVLVPVADDDARAEVKARRAADSDGPPDAIVAATNSAYSLRAWDDDAGA